MRRIFAFVSFASVAACSSNSTGGLGPDGGGPVVLPDGATFVAHEPSNHIPSPTACPAHTNDASALSDQCTTDADCGAGKGCMCGDQFPGNAAFKPNQCVAAQCQKDSDCGAGGWCSPSIEPMCASTGTNGYFCHTPNDSCSDDHDCSFGGCTFTGSKWECVRAQCAG